MTLLLSLLTAACADTGEVGVETAEFGESMAALSCPPRGALCVTATPTRWVDVSVDRAPSGEARTEAAQILQVTAEGYPARVTLTTDRGFSTDTAARLIADIRLVSGGLIPVDATAATAVASGSVPVPSIPAGVGSVTVPLLPLGAPRKLAAGTAYALTLRIEPGQTGITTLKVGAVDDGSAVNGKVSTRTRPLSNGILQPASFVDVSPAADLVFALQTEASSSNSCIDGAQGPLETDVDCGGTCSPCSTTKKCVSNADCASNSCVTGKCAVPNCNNSIFEESETDIDCGGVCATKCGQAKRCKIDGDCLSALRCLGAAATGFGTCRLAICSNGVKDQTETGVDCNSTNTPCPPCGVGSACTAHTQCSTGRCDLVAKKCIAATCSDKIADGGETDIDCGAVCGVGCAATKKCILNADCVTGSCVAGKCAPSPCLDKTLSPGESDVDCGGVCVTGNRVGAPTVLKCPANKLCGSDNDCATGLVCFNDGTAGRCVAATCGNGVKDLTETDTDCGGKCRPCINTKVCKVATDCLSKSCQKAKTTDATGVCKTTCSDKAINGGESDVDCGQSCASGPGAAGLCIAGKKCGTDLDCASGICDPAKRTCMDVCRNNTRDVTEGDVDCGGECKLKCMESQACRVHADCATGACLSGACVAASCSDGVKNGLETGIDCGGSCANDCLAGGSCVVSADCASGLACKANTCVTSTCTDLVQGGTEGDVDCGGSCATKCALTKKCAVNADCASATCVAGICRAATCANSKKDVGEGDIDCGATCSPCAVGKGCTVDAGCFTRNCNLTAKTCAAPSTTNTKADGDETDVNCGGSAPKCADTKKCMIGADCVSGSCAAGKCVKAACADGVKNGTETAVDCGGTCGACPSGRPCTGDTQCASNQCVSGVCTGYACTDGLRNGNESDVDCGGSCGRFDTDKRCDGGQKCASNTDCGFGTVCKGYVCVCPPGVTCGRVDDNAACVGVTCNTPPGPCFESAGTCRAGRCDYKPKSRFASCSDMDPCSSGDVCDGSGQCVGAPIVGCVAACTIATTVYAVGTRNPSNVCQVCDPEANPTGWTNVATGVSCDDGNVCTASDSCSAAGTCVGSATAGNQCGSGLVCASSGCESGCWISGQLVAPGATPNGNPCQKCDPVANAYGWTFVDANTACDDGLGTTFADACDGGGRCLGSSTKKSNGLVCNAATDCASGFCADGVCCNSACNAGTCDACSVREGASIDGVCAPVVANTKVCRPAAGECDAAEYCDGKALSCPVDAKAASGTLCAGGGCDTVGVCRSGGVGIPGGLVSRMISGARFDFSYIPAGDFTMGSPTSDASSQDNERPQHLVTISRPFLMLRTEVTQTQWLAISGHNPSYFQRPNSVTDDTRRPVEQVDWYDVVLYCNELSVRDNFAAVYVIGGDSSRSVTVDPNADGYRLPTEAEWEYAARAGTTTPRYGSLDTIAWYGSNSGSTTHPVSQKASNAWNLFDMLGNVREWNWDKYGPYVSGIQVDPQGPGAGGQRVIRGASWGMFATDVRAGFRLSGDSDLLHIFGRNRSTGFRIVRSLPTDASLTGPCSGQPAGTVCRASTGSCDAAEVCDGVNAACPVDQMVSANTICRASAGACDVAEVCSGASNTCPADGYATSGSSCSGGTCNTSGQCVASGTETPGGLVSRPISGVPFDFSYIPAGTFMMGSPDSDTEAHANEKPLHQVTITKPFLMLRTEVTQAQWVAIKGSNPSYFKRPNTTTDDTTRPVEQVSWYDVVDFCNQLSTRDGFTAAYTINGTTVTLIAGATGYRLPTEAEWEYAARAGTTTPRYGTLDQIGWHLGNSGRMTRPVGQKLPNKWNLYDMLGNVWEWNWDWYGAYGSGSQTDPQGPASGSARVLRGGSWNYDASYARAGIRGGDAPGARDDGRGFRPVRPLAADSIPTGPCSGQPAGTVCRASTGSCDAAEVCDGVNAACPVDQLVSANTICRASAGACDVAEVCSGTSAACPSDAKFGTSTVCRASAGACDVAEMCDGMSNTCGTDKFAAVSTVCRAAAGACDAAETCSGTSAACPADTKLGTSTVCRASAGVCDVAEVCSGTSNTCPADGYATSGASCSGGTCNTSGQCVATAPPTSGGIVQEHMNSRIHVFNSSGVFYSQSAIIADVLVVGGGGSGGSNNGGGGGGGGVRYVTSFVIPAGSHTVTVGAGAPGVTSSGYSGTQGDSSIFSTITSLGGGGGGGGNFNCGTFGGSGGGDSRGRCGAQVGTSGQGNSGASNPSGNVGGGGGGAGAAGSGRNGGAGFACSITGSPVLYGGGGGGGSEDGSAYGGDGGTGGGGQGGGISRRSGLNGVNGLGGGGGGDMNGDSPTGAGGSGVVIIRAPLIVYPSTLVGP